MKELLYGAAYYHEYMPYERLEQDVEMMKAAGMNVVRIAESTWSTLEIKEGQFNFSHIDIVLEAMEKAGIYVIIGTPTYAIPAWLAAKDEDVLALTKNGKELYGRRQNMNIVSRTFRVYAERVIRALMEHVKDRRCVIGYQLDNETKHYGTAGGSVQKLFVLHLKEKFKTIEAFNQAFGFAYWSNAVGSWDDLPDVRGTINASYACEFEKFQRQLVTDYIGWQADIVNQYKRADQFLTHNMDFEWKKFGANIANDGYSYGVQPEVNHYELAKKITLAGTDIYHMTQDDLTGAEIAFGGDVIRSTKNDNYLVLEAQAQAFKNWLPFDGQLRLQAYSHIANGANGVMYWSWQSIHNSYETYWKGLLSHDLKTNPTYEEAKVIGKEFRVHADDLVHLKKENKVAMLISNESLTALKWFPIDKDLSYNDVVRWMYDSLYEMNVECDFLFPESDNFQDYKVIITPALYCASEDLLERLKSFVENGGLLISSFKTAVSNEYVKVYHDDQPHILHECFGMTYNQFTEPGTAKLAGDIVGNAQNKIDYWMELLKPGTAEILAGYEHKYWGKYAAITKNYYGKGQAYYIGCYTSKDILKKIYQDAFHSIQLSCSHYTWPIIIRNSKNQRGEKMHFIFNYSMEDQSIKCPYQMAMDILSGEKYYNGQDITLKDWGVCILKEMS
jgi:beta-galactosidase